MTHDVDFGTTVHECLPVFRPPLPEDDDESVLADVLSATAIVAFADGLIFRDISGHEFRILCGISFLR